MDKYSAIVPVPHAVLSYFDIINGIADAQFYPSRDIEVIIEAKDDYDLARIVHELETELTASSQEMITIDRPKKILEKEV